MKLAIYQVDAFTSEVFHGNPAAVIVMDRWLDDEVLQAIAAENNLSETAFVIPSDEDCPLRWFTPTIEMDLCGHATLATAYILFRYYIKNRESIVFSTKSGPLTVSHSDTRLAMDFPSRPGKPTRIDDKTIALLGVKPKELLLARDLLAVLDSEEEVINFRPDYSKIAQLDAFALIVTAPGNNVDFVSRFFAPCAGVPEDPVTGSAHCTLIPYWAARIGRKELTARQLSRRGGELHCALHGERVSISGHCVEYLQGEITV